MNGKEKEDLHIVLQRMDQADKDRDDMHADIKFIKENLFNPKEGLWADVNKNTAFRESTNKWRSVVGVGVIGLILDRVISLFGK